jgi:glutaredoxin
METRKKGERFSGYCGRFVRRLFSEATPWARDNILWGVIVLLAPPAAAWIQRGPNIDWPTARTTLWLYLGAFLIYASVHVVRTAWKMDCDREEDITELEKEKADIQKHAAEKDLYIAELKESFSSIGGPNLFIGYSHVGGGGYPPLVVVNNEGQIAHNVRLRIPEDGSKVMSTEINILNDDGEPVLIPVGSKNMIDAADIIMAHAHELPVFLTCMDGECREFVYEFEPPPKASSKLAFKIINKYCVGRTKRERS